MDHESKIYIQAVSENLLPDTLRMIVTVKKEPVIALLDTRSTHNFVSKDVVKHLGLPHSCTGN